MLCFRCGSPVNDQALRCDNCGQDLAADASSLIGQHSFAELDKKLREQVREVTPATCYKNGELIDNRYAITEIIGTGALGTVFKAQDRLTTTQVAVKVISPEYLPDQIATDEFLKLMGKSQELTHPSVVKTLDVGRDKMRCFVVTPYVEGLSLRKIIKLRRDKGQRFTLEEIQPIYSKLASTLSATAQIMPHGNFKPENILFLPNEHRIKDFGLALSLPRLAFLAAQRNAGEAYWYLAPEVKARKDFDQTADVYSLAMLIVELLCGQLYLAGEMSLVELLGKEVPGDFMRVLKQALDVDPLQRQSNALELVAELSMGLGNISLFGADGKPTNEAASHRDLALEFLTTTELPEPATTDKQRAMGREKTDEISSLSSRPEPTHQLHVEEIEFKSESKSETQLPQNKLIETDDEDILQPPALKSGIEGTAKILNQEMPQPTSPSPNDSFSHQNEVSKSDQEQTVRTNVETIFDEENESDNPQGEIDFSPPQPTASERSEVTNRLQSPNKSPNQSREDTAKPFSLAATGEKRDRETRAREALQAFDFEVTLQEVVDKAAYPADPELPSLPRLDEASDSGQAPAPVETRRPRRTPSRPIPIAREVLNKDAVPAPLDPDVTFNIPREKKTTKAIKINLLPRILLTLGIFIVLVTAVAIYWVSKDLSLKQQEQKRLAAIQLANKSLSGESPVAVVEPVTDLANRGEFDNHLPNDIWGVGKKQLSASKSVHLKERAKDSKPEKSQLVTETKSANRSAISCPPGMKPISLHQGEGYCIDQYEYPGKGRTPQFGLMINTARQICKARGLRLCTAKEWRQACGRGFPYGRQYQEGTCNTSSGKVVATGSFKNCVSRFGVYDLSGNVAEWVEEGEAVGGDAQSAEAGASCASHIGAGPKTGFRCCSEPELD